MGHFVDAVFEDTGEWVPAEITSSEVSADGETFYYVHYIGRAKKFDDWVPASSVRYLSDFSKLRPSENSDELWPGFFQISTLSKQTTPGLGGAPSHSDPHEHSPKTIKSIKFGAHDILRTWYRSPYPQSVWSRSVPMFVCDRCLSYGPVEHVCSGIPGRRVYRDKFEIHEIDGNVDFLFCEKLFLLSKLFLEDKRTALGDSQITQVMPFLFYVVVDDGKFVGYFSKYREPKKDSPILSCILVLPNAQRKGYGNFLISLSYEIARREGRQGTAERPLSGPGHIAYMSWWSRKLRDVISNCFDGEVVSIGQLADLCWMTCDDVVETLRDCGALKWATGDVKLREAGKKTKIVLTMDIMRGLGKKTRDNGGGGFDPNKLNEDVSLCKLV